MKPTRFSLCLLLAALATSLAPAAENMIGQMSQNEGLLVLPAPAKVKIDGDLKDWDWTGRVWMFADAVVRDRYSAELAAMWDADNLYLAAKWKDPTPMFSAIDPAINPNDGWKADAWQMRMDMGDRALWVVFRRPERVFLRPHQLRLAVFIMVRQVD
jgi:hypothetical protein